jgi:hypothetical protein
MAKRDADEPDSSLTRLADFARKLLAVPKSEVDARVREFRERRRGRKPRGPAVKT